MVFPSGSSRYSRSSNYLFTAIEDRNISRLTQLFSSRRSHPNSFNAEGEPLIIVAVANSFFQGLKTISQQPGANLNLKNRSGETAMHVAARKGDLASLRLLAENRANKNIRDNWGYSPLHYAVQSGSYAMVDYLINDPHGKHHHYGRVDVNAVAYDGLTPLFRACYLADLGLIKLLLQVGAKIDRKDPEGYTLKAITAMNCWDQELGLDIPMDAYTDEFIQRKTLAHWNGIDCKTRIGRQEFLLWGSHYPHMHQSFCENFALFFQFVHLFPPGLINWKSDPLRYAHTQKSNGSFLNLTSLNPAGIAPEAVMTVIEAFQHVGSHPSPAHIAERVQKGLLTLVATGWQYHVIDLVFFRHYFAICNRGEGVPSGFHTVEVFVTNPKKVTPLVVETLLAQYNESWQKASAYFYNDLPVLLSPAYPGVAIQDFLCDSIARIAPSDLKSGTCSFAAAKAAARVSLQLMRMVDADAASYQRIGLECRTVLKDVSTLGRIRVLEGYMRFHFSSDPPVQGKSPPDYALARKVYAKARRHARQASQPLRSLFRFRLGNLREEYSTVFS